MVTGPTIHNRACGCNDCNAERYANRTNPYGYPPDIACGTADGREADRMPDPNDVEQPPRKRRAPPMPVAAYFEAKLGQPLRDSQTPPGQPIPRFSPAHAEFHIETECGADCRRAIDAAAAFLVHANVAVGTQFNNRIVDLATEIVLVYVYG